MDHSILSLSKDARRLAFSLTNHSILSLSPGHPEPVEGCPLRLDSLRLGSGHASLALGMTASLWPDDQSILSLSKDARRLAFSLTNHSILSLSKDAYSSTPAAASSAIRSVS